MGALSKERVRTLATKPGERFHTSFDALASFTQSLFSTIYKNFYIPLSSLALLRRFVPDEEQRFRYIVLFEKTIAQMQKNRTEKTSGEYHLLIYGHAVPAALTLYGDNYPLIEKAFMEFAKGKSYSAGAFHRILFKLKQPPSPKK